MKIGFIGLGKMGGGLARNLIRSGYDVYLYDISDEAVQFSLKVGGQKVDTPSEMASFVDVLFTSLPLPKHLLDLLVNDQGLLSQMKAKSTVVDVSTIDPVNARTIANEAEAHEIDFLACPLGKGPAHAEEGTQPIYAGGKETTFTNLKPMLEDISTSVHYLGDVEQATGFKLISNMVGMTNALVLFEGLKIGAEIGIESELLQQLLATTGADSYQLTLRGPMVQKEDYTPGFSTDLTIKDLKLGAGMAEDFKQSSEFTSLAIEYFQKAQQLGHGSDDLAATYNVFKQNT